MKRSRGEQVCLWLFLPLVVLIYVIKACPMGIPVDTYAHVDRKPIEIAFGLHTTPRSGCGGCIDACPVKALSFQKIGGKTVIATKQP